MSTPLSLIATGSFVSDGAARTLEFPRQPHYLRIRNRSLWSTAPTAVVESEWWNGMGAGAAHTLSEGGGSALTATTIAAGGAGFTLVDLSDQAPGAAVAITAITAATPAVAATAAPAAVGDIVRVYGSTGMLQIAGMDFSITAIAAGVSMTLGYLPAVGFAAAATAGTFRVLPQKYYRPRRYFVTAITAANPAVITVSVAHNYLVGDRIKVHCPAAFGMVEIDGLEANITAVTASTITTDINSAAFTAFAFPTSAIAAAGVSFPHVVPVGEVATKLTSTQRNIGYYGMYLDTGIVGLNTNIMDWAAYARDYTV